MEGEKGRGRERRGGGGGERAYTWINYVGGTLTLQRREGGKEQCKRE